MFQNEEHLHKAQLHLAACLFVTYLGTRRARREAVLKQAVEGATADGVYKGINNYIDYTAVRAVAGALRYSSNSDA